MRVSHRKIRKLPSLRRRHRPIDRAVGLERALVDATGGGRFDGADLDALGLDAGDAPERELALRWLCARANTITCRLITFTNVPRMPRGYALQSWSACGPSWSG